MKKKEKKGPDVPKQTREYPMRTTNQDKLLNWGPNEMIHEKSPQYPYYQLPHRGLSTNNTCFHSHSAEKIRRANGSDAVKPDAFASSSHLYRTGSAWGAGMSTMSAAASLGDKTYETTNQRNYQAYQLQHHERPKTCKPRVDEVRTGGFSGHFKTKNQHELKDRHYKPPAVDMIPYP